MKATKIIAAVIAGALTFGTITVPSYRLERPVITANAADRYTYADYTYEILKDSQGDYINIVSYSGKDSTVVIPSKIDGIPVKSIGYYSMSRGSYNETIESVIIPEGITTISTNAFRSCYNLKSISLPKSLQKLGSDSFYQCRSLETITIPPNVDIIGDNAFTGCESLEKVTISSGVGSIGEASFINCTALIEVTIPDSITSIGISAFKNCKNISQISMPDSVESIGAGAFLNCSALSSVTLSDNITTIPASAFSGCTSLKEINLPYYTSTVESNAFSNTKLEIINIGTKLKSINNLPIHSTSLKEINVVDDNNYYSSEDGILYNKNKSKLIRFPVMMKQKDFTVPDYVTEIGESAFADNTSIRNIYLHENCQSIQPTAFQRCSYLDKIYFYNKNCDIYMAKDTIYEDAVINGYKDSTAEKYANLYGRAFNVLPTTTSVTTTTTSRTTTTTTTTTTTSPSKELKLSVDRITLKAGEQYTITANQSNLTYSSNNKDVAIVSSKGIITALSDGEAIISVYNSDYDVAQLKVTVNASLLQSGYCGDNLMFTLDYKGKLTISGIGNMDNYTIASNNRAPWFNNLSEIKEVVIESGVTSIGKHAFGCYMDSVIVGITSVEIPSTVTYIDHHAFYNCRKLEKINIPNTVDYIGNYAFANCKNLKTINIPNSVTYIGDYAFSECRSLLTVNIPTAITSIERGVFANCIELESISIPSSVESIGASAFLNTQWLKKQQEKDPLVVVNGILIDGKTCESEIVIPYNVREIGSSAFYGCDSIISVTVLESVTRIGESAFSNCQNLKTVVLSDSVKTISRGALTDCANLRLVIIQNPSCEIFDQKGTISNGYGTNDGIYSGSIMGYKDSTAQAYAKKHGRSFKEYYYKSISGDVNSDGSVSIADAVSLQNFLLGRTKTLCNWKNADLCKDNRLDAFDMVLMRRLLIEKMS